jgi:hypothetical protein
MVSAAKARGDQFLDGLVGRHQHLATHVAALLHGGELVFEMHAGGAGRDHVLHQFEGVQHAAEAGFGIGHDGQEVVDEFLAFRIDAARPLDFVGALEGVVDAADHGRHRVVGIQRLVRVHGLGGVAIGSNLPARQVHRFEACLGLLHRLACTDGAEGVDVALFGRAVDQRPELLGAALGHGVFDREGTAQTYDILGAVTALDAFPAGIFSPVLGQGGGLCFTISHVGSSLRGCRRGCSNGERQHQYKEDFALQQ